MGAPRKTIALTANERRTLERWAAARSTPQGLVRRSRIVLLIAEGLSGRAIAAQLKTSRRTVDLWRKRYQEAGCAGLTKEQRRHTDRSGTTPR